MKILGYIITGVLSAAVAGGTTYFVTKNVVSKRLKEKYEEDLANQLNACRQYHKEKLIKNLKDLEKEYDSKEAAKEDIKEDEKLVITNPEKKVTAKDVVNEQAVRDYHKMYGAPTVETLFDDDDDSEEEDYFKRSGPYLIRRSDYFNEDLNTENNYYDKVELMLFTGDFIKHADGEKEYLEIMYADGRANEKFDEDGNIIPIKPDEDPYYQRVIPSSELAAILGQEWRHHFGDDTYDSETGDGYDYDENEVYVRNDDLKTDFSIIRDDRMYKCVIEGLNPGDNFDYSKVR